LCDGNGPKFVATGFGPKSPNVESNLQNSQIESNLKSQLFKSNRDWDLPITATAMRRKVSIRHSMCFLQIPRFQLAGTAAVCAYDKHQMAS